MTLEQIDYFICTVQSRTFFDAAENMHISQSSLSKQISLMRLSTPFALMNSMVACLQGGVSCRNMAKDFQTVSSFHGISVPF